MQMLVYPQVSAAHVGVFLTAAQAHFAYSQSVTCAVAQTWAEHALGFPKRARVNCDPFAAVMAIPTAMNAWRMPKACPLNIEAVAKQAVESPTVANVHRVNSVWIVDLPVATNAPKVEPANRSCGAAPIFTSPSVAAMIEPIPTSAS